MFKWWKSSDNARYIMRKCPVKVASSWDREAEMVRDLEYIYMGQKIVWMMKDECVYNSQAIKSWADAKSKPCEIISSVARVGRRNIKSGHRFVWPVGSKYRLDYVSGSGIVMKRLNKKEKESIRIFLESANNV